MTEQKEKIWEAAARYVSSESNAEDDQLVDLWQSESLENRKSFRLFLTARFRKKTIAPEEIKNQVFNKTFYKIHRYRDRSIKKVWYTIGVAASIALLIGTARWFYDLGENQVGRQQIEMYTSKGMKSKIVLPDGSQVTLNSNSKLTYPSKFNSGTREVILEGEAYFSVTKDARHPFVVKAGAMDVSVLGTKFNVKAYVEDNDIETTLEEGSVRIAIPKDGEYNRIILSPNEQAVWDKLNKTIRVAKVDSRLYAGWCEGNYYFKAKTFEEIARTLERVFNVSIDIRSERLNKEVYSGDFKQGENIEQILSIIEKNTNINYQVKGRYIIITESVKKRK
jgi:transmembrane sensor